ncbi:MAG TPA: phosphoribosyltransferase [Thermoanaerobaculia bacterium]|jgi:hypothetical protein|nr:phosphoribosyltransferase [Thermoanaerobaculia bacterium]
MAITYVRYEMPVPRLLVADPGFPNKHVLLFDPVFEIKPSISFGDRLRRIEPELLDADALIVRVGLDDYDKESANGTHSRISADRTVQALLKHTPIATLQPSISDGSLTSPRLTWLTDAATEIQQAFETSTDTLRSFEIQALLAGSEAILNSPEVHYSLPSGLHADGFVAFDRLATDATGVFRLSDWILDEIRVDTAILADQGAMLPVLLSLQVAGALAYGKRIPFRILREYPVEPTDVGEAVHDLLEQLGPSGHILFLLSVYSSGRTARFFRELAPEGSRLIALTNTEGEEPPGDYSSYHCLNFRRRLINGDGQCDLCSSSKLVSVSHRGFARTPFGKHEAVSITGAALEENKEFWEIAHRADAVRLHYDDANGRHQSVFLNTVALLTDPDFNKVVAGKLGELQKPDLVLIPLHRASNLLASLVAEIGLCETIIFVDLATTLPREVYGTAVSRVLLIDDVIITGKALSTIKQKLYQVERDLGKSFDIEAFVPIARPSRKDDFRYLKSPFWHGENHLHYCFQVLLPDHRGESCVLCEERRLLNLFIPHLSPGSQAYAQRRVRFLRGAVRSPFMRSDDGSVSQGALVGNIGRGTLFAAALSIARSISNRISSSDRFKELHVDARDLLAKFYDPELLGGFLRSFNRHELHYAGHLEDLRRRLEDVVVCDESMGLVEEIGWAGVQGKLPVDGVLKLIGRMPKSDALDMLCELVFLTQKDSLKSKPS